MAEIVGSSQSKPETSYGYSEHKSEQGTAYLVGHPAGLIPESLFRATSSTPYQFSYPVNWPVDDQWHNTDSGFSDETGISAYKVGNSKVPFVDYYVEITGRYVANYGFTDSDSPKDTYPLSVGVPGDHIVRYNSKGATISNVAGVVITKL